MKNILFLFFLIISLHSISQERLTVAVNEFTSNKQTKYRTAITNKVVEMMYKSGKINVLDRLALKKIQQEQYIQAGEEFMDSEITVEQGKLLKAKYLLSGNIEVINIMRQRNASGSILGYFCTISFTVKLLNVETGMTTSTTSFTTKKSKAFTPETSILASLESIEKKIVKYFKKELI